MALLDDVASIAKVAAASVDDIAAQAAKAGAKSAGVVIDDAAVTPRYVVGFASDREIPIVAKIAIGSLRNKLVFLLPAALLLSLFAPWGITPLLMLGGLFLCYEGAEKVYEALFPHQAHAHEAEVRLTPANPRALEDQKVAGAIRTDFILSAEIMAIALATLPDSNLPTQAAALALVGVGITLGVYGLVALIVKTDDFGLALASSGMGPPLGPVTRTIGRGLVKLMPSFLKTLATVGTAAMVWVGGGIIVHGLEGYGLPAVGHAIHHLAVAASYATPMAPGMVEWLVSAAGYGVFGLVIGGLMIPLVSRVLAPSWKALKSLRG
jgi:predicted DNA repair protein MutK